MFNYLLEQQVLFKNQNTNMVTKQIKNFWHYNCFQGKLYIFNKMEGQRGTLNFCCYDTKFQQ